MNRHALPALLAIVTLVAAGPLTAQDTGKIGLVNSQEILEKSVEGKKAFTQLQEAEKKYQADILRLDDQIKQLQNRLATQRLTLTVEAAAGIQADIQKRQTERQRTAEDAARAMQELQYRVLSRIQGELITVIEQLRVDRGLEIVFDLAKSGAAYSSPALDLTAEVIRRYDATKAAPPEKK